MSPVRCGVLALLALAAAACGGGPPGERPVARVAHAPAPDGGGEWKQPCDWPPTKSCVSGIAAGGQSSCITTRKGAYCWGGARALERDGAGVRRVALGDLPGLGIHSGGRRARNSKVSCELARPDSDFARCSGRHLSVSLRLRDEQPAIMPPPPFATAQVALGEKHACVLGRDGTVWCLGDNDHGQLGDGTTEATWGSKPRRVPLPAAKAIALGAHHSCALTTSGQLYCWGDLSRFPSGMVSPPLASVRWTHWADAGTGSTAAQHCLLSEDGEVSCLRFARWSYQRVAIDQVVEIAGTGSEVCALRKDRSVRCWSGGKPQPVAALEPADRLLQGAPCVLDRQAEVRCLDSHRLGRALPAAEVRALGVVSGMEASAVCSLSDKDELSCWGELGFDWWYDDKPPHRGPSLWLPSWRTRAHRSDKPLPLKGIGKAVALSPRGRCVLDDQGHAHLLVRVARGKGDEHRLEAVTATGAGNVEALLEGNECLARRRDGSVFRLQQPLVVARGPAASAAVQLVEHPELAGARHVELGAGGICARFANGDVRCHAGSYGEFGAFDIPLADYTARGFYVLRDIACALAASGLSCRELSSGTKHRRREPLREASATPVAVTLPADAADDPR
jgi:hypothetical protein